MARAPGRLDKIKRPGGVFSFEMEVVEVENEATWLWYPRGSRWQAPRDAGLMPYDALIQLTVGSPTVTWWIDDPTDRRVEVDICLPATRTDHGWSFVDLELDPVRHETSGIVEVEDRDEFAHALASGWMTEDDGQLALRWSAEVEQALLKNQEPWGVTGWHLLRRLRDAN